MGLLKFTFGPFASGDPAVTISWDAGNGFAKVGRLAVTEKTWNGILGTVVIFRQR